MSNLEFIEYIKAECKKHNVTLLVGKGKKLNYKDAKIRVAGWFSDNPATLAYAKLDPDCISTIVHEYCHMLQWLDKWPLWTESLNRDDDHIFDTWLNGKDYNPRTIRAAIKRIQKVELDCEKRSVKLIKKYNLNVNIEQYIKNANSYIYLYTYMLEFRKWPKKGPSKFPKINKLMPTKFLNNYSKLSDEIKDLYTLYCY